MRFVMGVRLVAIVAVVIGLSLAGTGWAAAQATFTATTHAMECYEGVGAAIFEECHTDIATSTEIVEIDGDTVQMTIPAEELAGYLGAYVYCRDLVDDEVLYDGSYADGVVFPVEDGDEIVCDVYFITAAPSGGTDNGGTDNGGTTTGGTTGGVTTLPATGAGPALFSQQLYLLMGLFAAGLAALGLHARRSTR